jgi:WD40 repeat-containing protein SMU1
MVFELIEAKEIEVARALMRQTQAMTIMKQQQPERYLRIEHLMARSGLDPSEVYPAGNKEKRRQEIADMLVKEVAVVAPSRLVTLLGQSLRFMQLQGQLPAGSTYDLFRGRGPEQVEDETFPKRLNRAVKMGAKSYAEVAQFSPDGQFLITGSVDGFIEVWDFLSGTLKKELKYQVIPLLHIDFLHRPANLTLSNSFK